MKKAYFTLALAACVCILPGCKGKQDAAVDQAAEAINKSVQSAPDELKSRFEAVDSALASNDFAKAKAAFDELQLMQSRMSPEQLGALAQKKYDLMVKASAAAQKGDAAAARIVQDVRMQSRSRR